MRVGMGDECKFVFLVCLDCIYWIDEYVLSVF